MIKCKYSYNIKRKEKKLVLPCGEKAFAGLQAKRHCGSIAAKYWCCLINGAQRDVYKRQDLMALGAIRALNDHGLRVPQDISVSGYDGIALGRYSNPRLTTIRQNSERLALRLSLIHI